MQKVAIIGSGAAGAGAVLGLLHRGKPVAIDVFDAAEPIPNNLARDTDPRGWTDGHMAKIYRKTVKSYGLSIPLPKTYFGFAPQRLSASDKKRIWRSAFRGGLTNFWGGTMLPLAEEDFDGWPVRRADMMPWYTKVCDVVGVSGRDDGLNMALDGFNPANRPPIQIEPLIEDFIAAINASDTDASAGVNRIALETRASEPNACVFCGECLIGCFKGAPFSTASLFRKWQMQGLLASVSPRRIHAIDMKTNRLLFAEEDGSTTLSEPYDNILLGAGCMGSTTILMNTLDVEEAAIEDSRVVNVPVVSVKLRARPVSKDGGFGLTHGLVVFKDASGTVESQAQLYPTLPHFWRSVLPAFLWKLTGFFGKPLRQRLLWARVYLPSSAANVYAIRKNNETSRITIETKPAGDKAADNVVPRFRRSLASSGYKVLGFLAKDGGSSSHYAAASPFRVGEGHVDENFHLTDNILIIDSTSWPSAPAMSPTLTIMANAMRLAAEI